ncbi:hypothetical protein [Nocardia abscessus]|uniref:hypothetical protein n=1 Tax=Nocardia abscessus TaxID=120957 RepID=UPI00245703CA|nr:hypothetical protein [Nocardia abscessus]
MQQAQLVTAPSPEPALDNGVGRPTKESVARRDSATPRTRNSILMSINPFSLFGLVAALDSRNIQAHLTDSVEDCAVCATVISPRICPAGRAAEITHATRRPVTAIEIVDQLGATWSIGAGRSRGAETIRGDSACRNARIHDRSSVGFSWCPVVGCGHEQSVLTDENRREAGVCDAV